MTLPAIQITDEMKAKAAEMVEANYIQYNKQHILRETGRYAMYHDAREALTQATFDANPQYCSHSSKPSGRPGYPLETYRFDEAQRQEAASIFDQAIQTIVAEAVEKVKGDKVPADFVYKDGWSNEYYGEGRPPKGVPVELTETGTEWQKLVAGRGDIART